MMTDILNKVKSFISNDQQFWFYHGYGLTFIWLIASTFAILVRSYRGRVTKWIHVLLFVIIDYITIFLGGGVIYKYWGKITSQFFNWQLIQQIHAVSGVVFVVFMTFQHIIGAVLFHKGYFKSLHIKQGYYLHFVVGFISIGGWLIHRNYKLAVATVFFYIMSQMLIDLIKKKGLKNGQKKQ